MRKVFFAFLLPIIFCGFSLAQNNNGRLLDQPMNLKSILVNINADLFTATTIVEMEFFNSNQKEIEGLYLFELRPGQVITDFKLELNGKYREGSIEEKWKARNAYNTIVGKRVDPALLQMDWQDHYRLNIYPIPANSSRKITMVIQQLMKPENNKYFYEFPFNRIDTTRSMKININVHHISRIPAVEKGLIEANNFGNTSNSYVLNYEAKDIVLSKPISFSIFNNDQFFYCAKQEEGKNYFAAYYKPSLPLYSDIHPDKITVFWDVSASGVKGQTSKEINFLQQYISYHNISQVTIIPFNHNIIDTAVFYVGKGFNSRWQQYLRSLDYEGATQLGILDLSATNSDVVFLVSDGKSTYGKKIPKTGNALVFCVNTSGKYSADMLSQVAGSGGGSVIDLNKTNIATAIATASKSQNWLLNISSVKGKTIYEQQLPMRINAPILINGIMDEADDTLIFYSGTNSQVNKVEKFFIGNDNKCNASAIERINMFNQLVSITTPKIYYSYYWEDLLEFGLKEKIVTQYTSYLVLERIEDYMKYNISLPKDLENEGKKLGYIKKDTRLLRSQLREKDEYEIISSVVNVYNNKLKQWDKNELPILLNRADLEQSQFKITNDNNQQSLSLNSIEGKVPGVSISGQASLDEVVVTGYGMQRKMNVTGAITSLNPMQIFSGTTNFGDVLKGRVAGLEVTTSAQPGSSPSIRIRGVSSFFTNSEPLILLDGNPVSGNINDVININDIDHIDILKDASATALYGSRGGNGVILVTTKKGRPYYNYSSSSYKLKDMEDVEYMQQIKEASVADKPELYKQLRAEYSDNNPGFYFDMAAHFFETGLKENALDILMEAAETSDGNYVTLKGIGYLLESWKYFDEAIKVYKQVLDINSLNLVAYRDLAWAYFQKGNYQQAIDTMHSAIKKNFETQEQSFLSLKAILLSEMNAIIELHKSELDISKIPAPLIRPMPVDLRILVDGNENYFSGFTVREPGGSECSFSNPVSKKGGYLNKDKNDYLYYYNGPQEYQIRNAAKGKYKIKVNYYDYYTPSFVRVTVFKNFGKENQSISVQHISLDNQFGTIEIGEVNW